MTSSANPGPSSSTTMVPPGPAVTSMCVPGGVWRTAFSNRLRRASRMALPSPTTEAGLHTRTAISCSVSDAQSFRRSASSVAMWPRSSSLISGCSMLSRRASVSRRSTISLMPCTSA